MKSSGSGQASGAGSSVRTGTRAGSGRSERSGAPPAASSGRKHSSICRQKASTSRPRNGEPPGRRKAEVVMTFRLPSPPPGACLVADEDGRGRPLLRWQAPMDGAERLRTGGIFGLWLCLWIVSGLGVAPYVFQEALDRSQPWDRRIPEIAWLAFWPVGLLVAAGPLWRALRGPQTETLLFE